MKGIKKNLMTGALVCGAAFNAHNAHAEVSKSSYGLKAGLSFSPYVGYPEGVKIDNKAVSHSIFDTPFVFGNLYFEYAFTDYVGGELGVGYMKQGATLTAEQEKNQQTQDNNKANTKPSIGIASHSIAIPLHLCVYPLGREEGEDILKIKLGGSAYIPFATTYSQNNSKSDLNDDQKKEKASFSIDAKFGLEYQFDMGVSIEATYSWGFMNRFKLDSDKEQTIFSNAAGLKNLTIHTGTVGVGYNFASLFSE
ncbi:MAG: PorT family protein [Candidatus Cardinium sp.]|uniref:PorT family protein n=1 Tax=Candidatus Cardinium sp. TP TaxID=2961955 RepID=UPI0021AE8F3F|nr:PorT family protein [Candidatus Cardinium sp. TP]MCT4697499.1 PorT family protein [Candidatus Cardinium sp. TP]MDN5247404.1 PorT family protein [Candidatus Cardinium sp.]